MRNQELDWDAFSRFVAGESDRAEAQSMEAWLAAHPDDAVVAELVKTHAMRADQSAAVSVDVESALSRVRSQFDAPSLTVVRGGAPKVANATMPSARTPSGRKYWVAAAAVLVTVVGVQAWRSGQSTGNDVRTVSTAVGQLDTVALSDGSKVMLAPGSTLRVAAGFASGERSVTLEGAAFFEVQHDTAHPFTVRANDAEIRDIGTAFSVNTDARGGVSVAVTHGAVALRAVADRSAGVSASSPADAAVELHAGDRGTINRGTVAVRRGTVTMDDIAWTHGQLSYRDTPMSDVQADLKRWYGINLEVADSSLADKTVTMPAQPDSARVISMIAAILGADVVQRGDTVVLHSAGRSTTP